MAKQTVKQPIEHGVAKVPVVMQMEALDVRRRGGHRQAPLHLLEHPG